MPHSSGSSTTDSPGRRFRDAVAAETPLQVPGVINAYCALMAQSAGFRALYLSGAGIANAEWGLPDLGMTNSSDVARSIERMVSVTELPLLVDADTGWGTALNIARTVKQFIQSGAAAMHIEDQETAKRCGHRPNKQMVSSAEMVDRIHAAVDARTDSNFVVMARTDALASEEIECVIDRCHRYIEAGADMIFAEAVTEAEQYRRITESIDVPVLANMTEFGKSPLMTLEELKSVGIKLVLYPLSAFRAMNAAANRVFQSIRSEGTQQNVLHEMQDRAELYEFLNYHHYEQQIDQIIQKGQQ